MRLIDTSKMQIPMKMVHNINGCYMIRVEDVQRIVSGQPTAYDVDMVVEHLQDFREEMDCFGCGGILTDIIEIVKSGGDVDA